MSVPGSQTSEASSRASSSLATDAGYQAALEAVLGHVPTKSQLPKMLQLCCARSPCPTELLEAACSGSDARQALNICSTVASFAHGPTDAAACFLPVARKCLEEEEHVAAAALSTAMACLARWRGPGAVSTTSRPATAAPLQLARPNQLFATMVSSPGGVEQTAHEAAGLLVLSRLRSGLSSKRAGGAVAQLRLDLRALAPWALLGLMRLLQRQDEPVVVSPDESLLIATAVVDNAVLMRDGHGAEAYLRTVLLARQEGGSARATARHGGKSSSAAQERAALLERAEGLVPPPALKSWAETMPPSAIVLACRQERRGLASDAGLSAWLLQEAPEPALRALASAAVGSEVSSGESNELAEEDLTFFISTEADPELCASSEEEEEQGSGSGLGANEDMLLLEDDDSEEE